MTLREFQRSTVPLLLVRFEQGRGKSGVPKVWVVPMTQNIETLVRQVVQEFRVQCIDAHARDLMPGRGGDSQYLLHNADGGVIEKWPDIIWEHDGNGQPSRSELVLTWGLPSTDLAGNMTDD